MAVDVAQIEGCYISSSLPKALFIPAFSKHQNVYRDKSLKQSVGNVLYFKPRTKAWETEQAESSNRPCSPVAGREHLSVQTDLYLEELCDVVEEADAQCETDPLLDRPLSPLFVPAKSGPDAETQIWPGELFNFDEEVEPLLEALVGQTLEQSILEVMAEEELAVLMDMQKDYEVRRNAEVAELKRLEEQERRICEEKHRRLQEREAAIKLEDEVSKKIAACIFSQNYLSELIPQVYRKLETQGFFETDDPEINEIEENFWPWLMTEVDEEIASLESSCLLLDSLIEDTVRSTTESSFIRAVSSDVYPEKESEAVNDEEQLAENTSDNLENASDNLENTADIETPIDIPND